MDARKEQIREFLKACRARMDPAIAGLGSPHRRRSPGLRREDVAALAGVSVTWYTWLEQGRNINVSADVLERICTSLRLSCEERDYLFSLVHGRPAPPLSGIDAQINDTLWRTIRFLPVPALMMTTRWDVVAWNDLVTRVFRDYGRIEPAGRNLLKIILTDEKYQKDAAEFEGLARRLLAKFRVDYSLSTNDPAFEQLIDELRESVPGFDGFWKGSEIRNCMQGCYTLAHDTLGSLCFDQSSYVPEGSSQHRLLMFIPHDAQTAAKITALAGVSSGGLAESNRDNEQQTGPG
jgi:transcriptional regulator with XRE-family HTH domain